MREDSVTCANWSRVRNQTCQALACNLLIGRQRKQSGSKETSMVIYLDDFRAAKTEPAAWLKDGTYGNDVMPAHCNPAVVQALHKAVPAVHSQELPLDLTHVD